MEDFNNLYITEEKFEMLNKVNRLESSIENIILNADMLSIDDYLDLFIGVIPKNDIQTFVMQLRERYPTYYNELKKSINNVDRFITD